METGICTLVDLDRPLAELLPLIAQAGFSHVSLAHRVHHSRYHLPAGRQALGELLARTGLKLNYIHTPIEDYHDITSPDPLLRRISVAVVEMVLHACAELKGRAVVVHACTGDPIVPAEHELRRNAGLQSLQELSALAAKLGVTLCLENMPGGGDCQSVFLELIHAADWPELKLCLDTCHAWIACADPLALVRQLAPRVAATHLSDTLGQHDSHLIPYQGGVPFDAVAAELGRAGYDGVVDLECSLWMLRHRTQAGRHHPGDPPAADVAWISTGEYLAEAHAAAQRIAGLIDAARG